MNQPTLRYLRFDNVPFSPSRAADEVRAYSRQRGDLDEVTVSIIAEQLYDDLAADSSPAEAAALVRQLNGKEFYESLAIRTVHALIAHLTAIDHGRIISAIVKEELTPEFVAFRAGGIK